MKNKLMLQVSLLVFATFSSLSGFGQLSGYYQQDFEGSFPPQNWQTVDVLDPSYYWQQSPFTVHTGNYSVYVGSAVNQGEDWLILPQFSVVASDSFAFWLTAESLGFTDSTVILVSTSNNSLSSFTSVLATLSDGINYPSVANLYQYYAYSLSAFAGQDIYVAFKNRNYEGDGVYIDLVSIGSQTGTGLAQLNGNNFNLSAYPNPFTEFTTVGVSLDKASTVSISIVDVMGKEVKPITTKNLQSGNNKINLDLTELKSGVYFFKIESNENFQTIKLIKNQRQ